MRSSTSELFTRYAGRAERQFPYASRSERDLVCLDLQRIAENERLDLDAVLREHFPRLLLAMRQHQQQPR